MSTDELYAHGIAQARYALKRPVPPSLTQFLLQSQRIEMPISRLGLIDLDTNVEVQKEHGVSDSVVKEQLKYIEDWKRALYEMGLLIDDDDALADQYWNVNREGLSDIVRHFSTSFELW